MRGPADVALEGRSLRGVSLVDGGERDPHAQARRHRPARDVAYVDPAGKDAEFGPRTPAVLHPHADETRIVVPVPLGNERLPAEERPVPFHEPGAVHLERRLPSVEILTGQEVAFFQSKGVPRAEPDRPRAEVLAGLEEGVPHPSALARGGEQLEARLACVPGAGRQERGASTGNGGLPRRGDGGSRRPRSPPPLDFRWNGPRVGAPRRRRHEVDRHAVERLDVAQVHGREALQELGSPRPLDREAQDFGRPVRERDVAGRMRFEPPHDRGSRSRVADEEEPVRREARHDDVVEDRAVVAEELRVPRPTRDRGDVVRAQAIQERVGGRTLDENLAHVAHVEQANGPADREMVLVDPGVLERHLPSGEFEEPRAGGAIRRVQRRPQRHDGPQREWRMKGLRSEQSLSRPPTSPAATMGLFRELRYELSALIFALGILGTVFSLTQYLIPTQSPTWLQSIHVAVGQYVLLGAFFGFLAVLAGGFYFVDTIRKEREFDRLISTPSKEVFVKNMKRIEELTYDHLPSAYEHRFLEKKREFRIRG